MKNPDKYLRQGYLAALRNHGLTVFNKDIPPNIKPIPSQYVLVESQSKTPTARSKEDFEWNCRIILHIISINQRGYSATTFVNDAEEKCINAVEEGIQVPNFYLKSTYLIESQDLDMTDKTTTIERKVLIYEHWLSEVGFDFVPFTPIFIPAGTPIPYFIAIVDYPIYNSESEVITEIQWEDPETGVETGQLVRVYDMPAVKQDTNGDGTGTFTGWNLFGHQQSNALNFLEDTYVILR